MSLNFNQASTVATLGSTLDALKTNINYNLNCIKVASVISFNPENLTVSCRINNKRLMGLEKDGNQILKDYPIIYAKVHFFGWGDVGATYPIEEGMEGFLLFNDRELETWFTTGESGNVAYNRCHDLTDAIFICGVHSLPNMIQMASDCLHLFYKNSEIKISRSDIDIKTTGGITIDSPDVTVTGNLNVGTGVSAMVPCGGTTLVFSNGILTGVQ